MFHIAGCLDMPGRKSSFLQGVSAFCLRVCKDWLPECADAHVECKMRRITPAKTTVDIFVQARCFMMSSAICGAVRWFFVRNSCTSKRSANSLRAPKLSTFMSLQPK